jgi:tetratricopeptide (TPR) repeat protein
MATLWLKGWAQHKTGAADEGADAMSRAARQSLADGARRFALARAISQAGADAGPQWELVRRLDDPDSWETTQSYRETANAAHISGRYSTAADFGAIWLLRSLRGRGEFTQPAAYLSQPYLLHRARSLDDATKGDWPAALREAGICLAALPMNTMVPIELCPLLDSHGRRGDADELFKRVFAPLSGLCAEFPDAAEMHNSLAWMCAKCGRELDAAADHAASAVRVSPTNTAYLDTLAEVDFRRGDREGAVELMKKCLAFDARSAYFQSQMKRFTASAAATLPVQTRERSEKARATSNPDRREGPMHDDVSRGRP